MPVLSIFKKMKENKPPKNFHRFNDLSTELRLEIWNQALPGSRIIKVTGLGVWCDIVKVSQCIPAMLHTNREAREIALKFYLPILSDCFDGKSVYFAPDRDVLCFANLVALFDFNRLPKSGFDTIDMCTRIRQVMICGKYMPLGVYRCLACMKGIEILMLQAPSRREYEDRLSSIVASVLSAWNLRNEDNHSDAPKIKLLRASDIKYYIKNRKDGFPKEKTMTDKAMIALANMLGLKTTPRQPHLIVLKLTRAEH